MRARGAGVTDIVVLVVAADDGVMPQTIEAIRHAKAANAPIIVAINKMDRPDANPERVRQELLSHEVVVEEMGGETQDVEVSALKKTGLDKLEEAILLQAEILDLRANPDRPAEGAVIESRLDRGRGPVATVLVQKGTLQQGDIVVAGAEWGRVRAMLDDKGQNRDRGRPVGAGGDPRPDGRADRRRAVRRRREREPRARNHRFRTRRLRDKAAGVTAGARGTLDEMLARIQAGEQKEVAVLIKADVQGSAEAIQATVLKLAHEEVKVRVLLAGVGQITESDMQLAKASKRGDRRVQCARHSAGARPGAARRRRYPLLLDHLRSLRRHREAGAGQGRPEGSGEVPGLRRGPQGVQHHQGRQGRGLHGHRRPGEARRRRAACCATTW